MNKSDQLHKIRVSIEDFVFSFITDEISIYDQMKIWEKDFGTFTNDAFYFVSISVNNQKPDIGADNYFIKDIFVKEFDQKFICMHHKKQNIVFLYLQNKEGKEILLENVLNSLFSSRCIHKGMLLLHASAIIKNDKAVLFIGKSGAGKSTVAQLSGHNIIHDDVISIKYIGNRKFRINTIPFKEKYKNLSFTGGIDAVYNIVQSRKTFIREMSRQEQYMRFLSSLWNFNEFKFGRYENDDLRILKYCKEIMAFFPVRELHFKKDKTFLELI